MITEFTDLKAWQLNHELVLYMYRITIDFPDDEKFGLTSQLRRASVSITSNIAEGFGRRSYKEKVRFYYLVSGSLSEVKNQLIIAKDLNYISHPTWKELFKIANEGQKVLYGLINSTKKLDYRSTNL